MDSTWTLHGLYNTVPDTSSYGISNMNCTPGLGRPGINGSNGKMENLIQPCRLLVALGGINIFLWMPGYERKEKIKARVSVDVGDFVVWSKIRTKSGNESYTQ